MKSVFVAVLLLFSFGSYGQEAIVSLIMNSERMQKELDRKIFDIKKEVEEIDTLSFELRGVGGKIKSEIQEILRKNAEALIQCEETVKSIEQQMKQMSGQSN